MSALFDEVSRLYRIGHDGEPPDLFGDQRLPSIEISEFRPAAVLAAFTDRADPGILLLHRPSNMRSHPGQIAFPGGGIDPGETPVEAALREAWEELGIHARDVRVIGTSDVYRTHSGFEITPVLGVVPADIEITPNPTEVAQWFEAPARFVLDPANQIQQWVDWEGAMRAYYEIPWQGHQIWGITAAILVNLSRRLRWHG
jgi:8-oxo-dGTP pyrophosphatase MutT (NUDIX family)